MNSAVTYKLVWNQITPSDRQLGGAAGIVAVQAGMLGEIYLSQWECDLRVSSEFEGLLSRKIKPKKT